MTWSQEISQLITDVDQLTSAANVKKSTLDASVASTEADKDAVVASANAATVSAAASLTRAQESEAHKNTALAVYGTTAAQQTAVASVQASSALASGYAASGSAALQQDLSGITTQALHRSPNAITSMFIYDTGKDSDGGAWTEKCQNTSWYNEPIMGKWLGPQSSEFNARSEGATLGTSFGDIFSSVTGYTVSSGASPIVSSGWLQFNPGGSGAWASKDYTTVVGRRYRVTGTFRRTATNATVFAGTGSGGGTLGSIVLSNSGTFILYFTASTTTSNVGVQTANGTIIEFQLGNLVEVLSTNTQSGDYFQLSTDGKFYRLWKNLLEQSTDLTKSVNGEITASTLTANTIVFTAPTAFAGMGSNVNFSGFTGQTFTASVTLSSPDGKAAVGLWAKVWGAKGATGKTIQLTTTPTRHTISVTATGSFSVGIEVVLDNRAAFNGDGTTSGTIIATDWQMEYGSSATGYEPKNSQASITEVFRGNKRDFPRLAALVAEASNVTIYDLTEPGRPMWRRFVNTGAFQSATFRNVKSVNGSIFIPSTLGFFEIGLIADQFVFRNITSKYHQDLITSLSVNRLIAIPGARITTSSTVHDVAFLLDSKTPVDPVTGMQYPVLAIATLSDASLQSGVILTGETVLTIGNHGANSSHHFYRVFANGEDFWFYRNYFTGNSYGTYIIVSKSALIKYSFGNFVSTSSIGTLPLANFDSVSSKKAYTNKSSINIIKENNTTPNKSIFSVITPSTVYGWFAPNVRRCYIAALLEGSITPGSNLVLNGNFTTGIEGWSTTGQGFFTTTWDSINQQAVSSCITSFSFVWATGYTIATIPGAIYRVSANITQNDGFGVRIQISNSAGDFFGQSRSGVGQVFLDFIADATTSSIQFGTSPPASPVGKKFSFDDVIATRRDASRYPSLVGAELNGTLSMAKVASGTSLVGYSGWSTANYLQEPYSADLDFGTGEFSASAWVNIPVTLPSASFPLGTQIVVNGTFDGISDGTAVNTLSGWSLTATPPTSATIEGNRLRVVTNSNLNLGAVYTASTIVGRTYVFECTAFGHLTGNSIWFPAFGDISTATGSVLFYFVANSTSTLINFRSFSTTEYDNISIRDVTGPAVIFDRAHSSGTRIRLGLTGTGRLVGEAFDGTTTRTVTTTSAYNIGAWLKADVNYTTDGILTIRVNGRGVAATLGNPLLTLNNTSAVLTIGNSYILDAPFPGSIALLKLGATVPTTEQSIFMYEQEKRLFRTNAVSVLPDSNPVIDMSYDDATDRWVSISTSNESYWNGLVRTSVTPVPAGSYSKIATTSGIELAARTTINPGVDVTIPAYVLREELVKRSEPATKLNRQITVYDYIGGFTGNITAGSTAIASVTNFTYPVSAVGARISGTGIPTNATITAVGTTTYISTAATATTTGLLISFLDFNLPVGFETESVTVAGIVKQEGATKDYIRLFDGFIETIRFAVAPGSTTWVRIQATKSIQ